MPIVDLPGTWKRGVDGPDPVPDSDGLITTLASRISKGALPMAAGVAAAEPGAIAGASLGALGGPLAPITVPLGTLIGGAVTGIPAAYAAGWGQNKLVEGTALEKQLHWDEATQAQQKINHPIASVIGDVAPALLGGSPASLNPLKAFGYLSSEVPAAMKVGGLINAGVSGATALGQQMAGDGPVDLTDVAGQAIAGLAGMKPNFASHAIGGIGRSALPADMVARYDARNSITPSDVPAVAPNDGSGDQGAAGGAGAPTATSATNQAMGMDLSGRDPNQSASPAAQDGDPQPQQMALPLTPAENTYPPPGYTGAPPPDAPPDVTPIRQAGPMDQGGVAPPPDPDAPAPINGLDQSQPPAPQPQTPVAPTQLPIDPTAQVVSANFSPVQVLRTLRDVAGSADKPASPDSYMLQLSNGISKHISVNDPDGHAVHGYLADQMQILDMQNEQIKEHILNNQVSRPNTPEQVKLQDVLTKKLDSAQTQTEKQIKTLGAAQDAMPTLIAQLKTHTNAAQAQRVAPAFQNALDRAKARIAAGDTGGVKIGVPEPSPAGTVDQMAAKNATDKAAADAHVAQLKAAADAQIAQAQAESDRQSTAAATAHTDSVVQGAQALHEAKVRDNILQGVLDDPTTLNPMSRFRAALRKAGVKDMSVTEAEANKISRFEDAREAFPAEHPEPDEIPSSPNEMDSNLVPEAKPKGEAGTPKEPNIAASKFQLTAPPAPRDAAAIEAAQARRARRAPPEEAAPAPEEAPDTQGDLFAGHEDPNAARANEVASLGDVVKEAGKQGAIDKGTSLKLLHELTKPDPNLDMVRSTVAKGAKRLEATTKVDAADQTPQKRLLQPTPEPALERTGNAPTEGMSKADVQSAVNEHTQGWTGAPKVQVHQDASTLPEHLSDHGNAAGVYDPSTGTAHLIAKNIASPSDAHATLFHEALGHAGLRKVFGDRLTKVLDDSYRTNPELQRQAKQWIADNKGPKYDSMAPADLQRRATEEVLAHASESGAQKYAGGIKGVVQRVKSFVRDTAQRMGIKKNYSNEDVTNILRRAHEGVTDGSPVDPRKSALSEDAPLERKAAIGGTPQERVKNLLRPELMKENAHDQYVNMSFKARNVLRNFQDLGWITESADKMFTVGGVNGEHLLTKWKDTLSRRDADKNAAVEKSRGPHDLYVALPKAGQEKVKNLLLAASDAAIEVRTPRTAKGDAPALEAGLRKQYDALSPKEKAAHDGMRQEFSHQLTELRDLFKSQVKDIYRPEEGDDAETLKQKAADKSLAHSQIDEKFKELPGYFPMHRFGDHIVVSESPEWGAANDKLDALKTQVAKASPEDQPALKEQLKEEQVKFDKMQDAHREVSSFETPAEQKRHADMMRKKGWDVREKLATEYTASTDGVSGSFVKQLMDHLDKRAELNPDQKDGIAGMKSMINQMVLQHMPASSAMKRQMSRKGVAGYSTDVARVYAAVSQRNAGFLNEIKYGMKTSDLLAKMHAVADKAPGTRPMEIYNHLKSMFDLTKQYANNPITQFMSSASYAYYLGGSASFSIMHMMQTPMVTWGMLTGEHGPLKAAHALLSAGKEVFGNYKSLFHGGSESLAGKTPGERMSIELAARHNLIAGTHSSGFINAAMGEANALTKLGRGIMAVSSFMPHHVERANRLLTNLAAYRLAINNKTMLAGVHDATSAHYISDQVHQDHIADHIGYDPKYQEFAKANPQMEPEQAQAAFAKANPDRIMTKEQLMAARYAEKVTGDSHVDYAASNSPKLLQQMSKLPVLGWSTQFQKYQFGMLKVLGQNAGKVLDRTGEVSSAEKKVARRTLAGVLGMHAAVTGMMGLPGAGLAMLAANVYHKAFGDPDDPFDAETSFRKSLAGLMGKEAGDVAARGLLYAPGIRNVAPADITDRLGMGDLGNFFNATRLGEKINSDSLMSYIGTQVTGPVGSIYGNMANAYQFQHEGDYQRALEEVMPKALRDMSKAQRYATVGVTTGTGMPVVGKGEIGAADIATQILGFTPQSAHEAYAQRQAMADAKTDLEDRRNVIIKQFIREQADGDTTDARAKMNQFNQTMRDRGLRNQVLNMSTIMKAVQERRIAQRRLQGGTSATPRERALRDQFGDYSAVTDEADAAD